MFYCRRDQARSQQRGLVEKTRNPRARGSKEQTPSRTLPETAELAEVTPLRPSREHIPPSPSPGTGPKGETRRDGNIELVGALGSDRAKEINRDHPKPIGNQQQARPRGIDSLVKTGRRQGGSADDSDALLVHEAQSIRLPATREMGPKDAFARIF